LQEANIVCKARSNGDDPESPEWLDFGLPKNSPLLKIMMRLMKESVQSIEVIDKEWIHDGSILQPFISKFVSSIHPDLLNNLDRSGQNAVDGRQVALIICDPPYGFFPEVLWDVPAGDLTEGLETLGLELKGTLSTSIQVCIEIIWCDTW
jgi:hypothetical protein